MMRKLILLLSFMVCTVAGVEAKVKTLKLDPGGNVVYNGETGEKYYQEKKYYHSRHEFYPSGKGVLKIGKELPSIEIQGDFLTRGIGGMHIKLEVTDAVILLPNGFSFKGKVEYEWKDWDKDRKNGIVLKQIKLSGGVLYDNQNNFIGKWGSGVINCDFTEGKVFYTGEISLQVSPEKIIPEDKLKEYSLFAGTTIWEFGDKTSGRALVKLDNSGISYDYSVVDSYVITADGPFQTTIRAENLNTSEPEEYWERRALGNEAWMNIKSGLVTRYGNGIEGWSYGFINNYGEYILGYGDNLKIRHKFDNSNRYEGYVREDFFGFAENDYHKFLSVILDQRIEWQWPDFLSAVEAYVGRSGSLWYSDGSSYKGSFYELDGHKVDEQFLPVSAYETGTFYNSNGQTIRYENGKDQFTLKAEEERRQKEKEKAEQEEYEKECQKYGKKYVDAWRYDRTILVGTPEEYFLNNVGKVKLYSESKYTRSYHVYTLGGDLGLSIDVDKSTKKITHVYDHRH